MPSFSLLQKAASHLQADDSRGMKAVSLLCESWGTGAGTPEQASLLGHQDSGEV